MENQQEQIASTKSDKMVKGYKLEVLKTVKKSQQAHGLRHTDYERYRSYCNRRLRRLRKSLNLTCGNMKNFKNRSKDLTKQFDVPEQQQQAPPSDIDSEASVQPTTKEEPNDANTIDLSRYLQIPLYEAERAWAYAMQLKQESNTDIRKKFHLVNRLKKACKHSTFLLMLSVKSASALQGDKVNRGLEQTRIECEAYNLLMNGTLTFELSQWTQSLEFFLKAKALYEKLGIEYVDKDSRVYYIQKVDEIIPNIRYCIYNLQQTSAKVTSNENAAVNLISTCKLDGSSKASANLAGDKSDSATAPSAFTPQEIERIKATLTDLNLDQNDNQVLSSLDFEPIACKPLFFDLALNYIELPSIDDRLEALNRTKKTQQQTQQQQSAEGAATGGGVKGFLKGLWGSKK